jgi:hypothetical protein
MQRCKGVHSTAKLHEGPGEKTTHGCPESCKGAQGNVKDCSNIRVGKEGLGDVSVCVGTCVRFDTFNWSAGVTTRSVMQSFVSLESLQ